MRGTCLYAGLLISLVPAIIGGCVNPQGQSPVTYVDVAVQAADPAAQQAGITFTVAFDADVIGFDDPLKSVLLEYAGTSGGNITITAIDGRTYLVTVTGISGEGTFTLVIPQGAATDSLGNPCPAGSSQPVTVDTTAPTVTVNALATKDTTPALTGAVNDPQAGIVVGVAGNTYAATNNGNGTWTLADNAISPALTQGKYDAAVTATDAVGNVGEDATVGEITIDVTAPTLAVNTLVTTDSTPRLSGTVDDPEAVVAVTVAGKTYGAANNGNGTWTLADNMIDPALADGQYDLLASATDALGNVAKVTAGGALTIDTSAPAVGISTLVTNDIRPVLAGTVDDTTAIVRVAIEDDAAVQAANNGDGTWILAVAADIADGQYDLSATASDAAGNSTTATQVGGLTVDTLAPVLAVNPLVTADSSPMLEGTVTDATATTVKVRVSGQTYDAAVAGDTWTLAAGTIAPALEAGSYSVTAEATDAAGNQAAAVGDLTITSAPAITAASLAADNSYMDITFDQPVYGNAANSHPIGVSSLIPTYTRNDDPVTDVTIVSVQTLNGDALIGGESAVRVGLSLAAGPTEGLGFIRIQTAASAVYNAYGQAAATSTGDRRLRDPANLLAPYDWSFEGFTGAAGPSWNPVNAYSASTYVHSGQYGIKFLGPTDIWTDHSVTIPDDASGTEWVDIGSTPGTKYEISAWVYVKPNTIGLAADTGLRLQLKMEKAGGGFVTWEENIPAPPFHTWTRIAYVGYTPGDVNLSGKAWVTFLTRWLSYNDSDVFLDDVRLTLP